MSPSAGIHIEIDRALAQVAVEHSRADRAAQIAERHERTAASPTTMQAFHLRMATTHRENEARHRAAARMHQSYANHLSKWADADGNQSTAPLFMSAVAETFGAASAAMTLLGKDSIEVLVAASSPTARVAQDLEFTLGEGPARDTVSVRQPILATGTGLVDRWPHYGPAINGLGVRAVASAPLQLPTICLGALIVFDPRPATLEMTEASLHTVAAALTHTVLQAFDSPETDEKFPRLPLFDQADYRASVHQAAGIVSVQCGCSIADALSMMRARAFASNESINTIARRIVRQELRLS